MAAAPKPAAPLNNSLQPQRTVSGTRPAQQAAVKSSTPAPDRARVEIELNVFSDQANPRWLLSKARTDALLSLLPKEPTLIPLEVTGYRGFTIRIESAAGKRTVQVFHNTQLERWLLNSGRFCLTDGLARFVETQLA